VSGKVGFRSLTQPTNCQFTNYPFTNPTGSHFAFRVTAADRVGNADSVEAASRLVEVTKYYTHGGRRVAMRRNGVVTYLHGDHLGSTSLVTNDTGGFVARVLYYPYGEERYEEGTLPTDYQYTGQRHEQGIELYDYGARYYDPYLNRWLSADTIVPDPANPQSLNRFAYVLNNPLKYVDPTGHIERGQEKDAGYIVEDLSHFGLTIEIDWGGSDEAWDPGSWELWELVLVLNAVQDLAAEIGSELNNGLSNAENFRNVIGQPLTIRRKRWYDSANAVAVGNEVWLYNGTFFSKETVGAESYGELYEIQRGKEARKGTIVHEIAHVWDNHQNEFPVTYIGRRTMGEPPPTLYAHLNGDNEDWAELVKCSVYPSQIDLSFIPTGTLGPKQQAYFSMIVNRSDPTLSPPLYSYRDRME
jgi:RHS repeat-associated protein